MKAMPTLQRLSIGIPRTEGRKYKNQLNCTFISNVMERPVSNSKHVEFTIITPRSRF